MYISNIDSIYCPKTKEYFKEVLSSYSSGNYRSAVVMLYSVAICDLLYKLQELKDMYNDSVASRILSDVESYRNTWATQPKARWEKELIDRIFKDTTLLSLEDYTHLNHLYDHRNFSAHPALNENFDLISPSRENTIAHINNILSGILVKPPIFISDIVEHMSNDLDEKRELYLGQDEKLREYLNRKYFDNMPVSMKKRTFKAFWKFCFRMPDDDICKRNRKINRRVLLFLFESSERDILDYIKHDISFTETSTNKVCLHQLCYFLSECPAVYELLSNDTKLQIASIIASSSSAKVVSWFLAKSMESHIMQLICSSSFGEINPSVIEFIASKYENAGKSKVLVDYFIEYFSSSTSYNDANSRYATVIKPYLHLMNCSQFERLIFVINTNSQIYNRTSSCNANTEIMIIANGILSDNFKFSDYPNFRFNQLEVNRDSSSTESSETRDNSTEEVQF